MILLSPRIHMFIDLFVIVFLVLSPTLFDLSYFGSQLVYGLAIIHFALTVFTDFGKGIIKLIPFSVHGLIELLVSLTLVILSFTVLKHNPNDHAFFLQFGIAVFLLWLATTYDPNKRKGKNPLKPYREY